MKLCSYHAEERNRFGLVTADGIVDLNDRTGHATLRDLITASALADISRYASETPDAALDKVEFALVIPNPEKIYCVGLNYHDHVAETGNV